jgi:hypothetical protein
VITEVEPAGVPGTPMLVTGTRQFVYSHLMFREVARDMVPKADRPRLQLAFVDWLDEVAEQLPAFRRVLHQTAAVNSYLAWQGLSRRGPVEPGVAQRTVDYCLSAAATTAACGATREASELMSWAEEVGATLPDGLAGVQA